MFLFIFCVDTTTSSQVHQLLNNWNEPQKANFIRHVTREYEVIMLVCVRSPSLDGTYRIPMRIGGMPLALVLAAYTTRNAAMRVITNVCRVKTRMLTDI